MQDTSVKADWVQYSRYMKNSNAPRDEVVRIYRGSPERVTLQLRNDKHYMTATLDVNAARQIVALLLSGLEELPA